ncbi:quaternary amine ABC transporter ATP-binding protein [Promicromonospora soli]
MIEASNLSKAFGLTRRAAQPLLRTDHRRDAVDNAGGFLAVDDVSFCVERGELFVIMGLSGSGKSTLLRMINRLVDPTAGQMSIDGSDVVGMSDGDLREARNRRISMVFQHFALFPHRTIRENAAYGLKVRGVGAKERLERADWALERVGLGNRGDARPAALSGGMKQRVGLARALATGADILLMDEPFSALDPLIKREMQELLLALQAEDERTIIFVTHDLNEAMRIGHRIMVMKDGRVVQCDTGPQILSSPANEYVSDFVADVDRSRVLTASSVMRPPAITARLDESPSAVLDRLGELEMNGVFVVDEQGSILGVARDDLLARAMSAGESDLRSCLVQEYETVSEDRPLAELFQLAGRHVVPVGVVDEHDRLLGVVPRAAILSSLAGPRKVMTNA